MKKLKVNNGELAYRDEGNGNPIIFLHAFPLNQSMWNEQVTVLLPKYRVISFDWRGFGESEIGTDDSTMPAFADDLAVLLDQLQIDRAVICGLSMGGYAALAFHRKYTDRVKALVLCDTKASVDTEEAKRGRYEMAKFVRNKGASAIVETMVPRLLGKTTLQNHPHLVTRVSSIIEAAQVEGIAQALIGMAQREDSTDSLSSINCPTLVIVGNEDQLTPPTESDKINKLITTSELKIISDAGHLPNLEQPEIFNQTIGKFLEQFS